MAFSGNYVLHLYCDGNGCSGTRGPADRAKLEVSGLNFSRCLNLARRRGWRLILGPRAADDHAFCPDCVVAGRQPVPPKERTS